MMPRWLLVVGLFGVLFGVSLAGDKCGGTITKGEVLNAKTNLTDNVTKATECIWIFEQDKNESMYIYFKDFFIQPGDTFTILNGANVDGQNADKIISLSGAADPSLVVVATQAKVQVTFKGSDAPSTAKRSFNVSFSIQNCEVPLDYYSSSISTPVYIAQPQQTIDCIYNISTDHSGSPVALSFSKVNITKGSLRVWDGNDTTLTPVIDTKNPTSVQQDVIGETGKLMMEVVITASRPNQTLSAGFITGHNDCFKTITVHGPMTLQSPGYPSKYTSHLHCKWVLQVPKDKADYSIKAMFADLDLASAHDTIRVNAGGSTSSPTLGTFTKGSPLEHVLVSGNGMMYIELSTGDIAGGRGFNLALTLSPYDKALFGSGHIEMIPEKNITSEVDAGQIDSPATADDDIFYQLIADDGKKVELVINATDTLVFPTSLISIHDGNNPTAPLLAQFRTDNIFFKVQSTGENMLVILQGFKRNGTMTRQTFSADFDQVKEATIQSISDISGVIELNSSSAVTNRTWMINTYVSDNQVALRLHSLDLNPGQALNIYDGLAPHKKIVVLNNDVMNLPVVYAKQMRIDYVMNSTPKKLKDPATSDPVISASFEQITACGGQVSGTSGVLVSPEWPNRYPYNAECSWTFQPVRNSTLHLAFTSFALFEEHTVTVKVKDYYTAGGVNVTETTLAKLTGLDIPNDIMVNMDVTGINNITSREVTVKFSSEYQGMSKNAQVGDGFKINYEYLNSACSKNVTNITSISTPGWPNVVPSNLSCLWIISQPPRDAKVNTTVNVLQYTINLKHVTEDNSSKNTLEIHDGGAVESRIIPVKLTEGESDSMQSSSSQLWVKYTYIKTNSSKGGFAFELDYKTYGCPISKQCANARCMQDSWICNGIDDCGDMSDEKDCTTTVKGKKRYSGLVLGLAIVGTMILTLVLAFVIPIIYKRIKYPNYGELRDLMVPVDS